MDAWRGQKSIRSSVSVGILYILSGCPWYIVEIRLLLVFFFSIVPWTLCANFWTVHSCNRTLREPRLLPRLLFFCAAKIYYLLTLALFFFFFPLFIFFSLVIL